MSNLMSICLSCGVNDSYVSTLDVHFCNDCYATEQDFIFVENAKGLKGFTVDEQGYLYKEFYEIEGPIGSYLD